MELITRDRDRLLQRAARVYGLSFTVVSALCLLVPGVVSPTTLLWAGPLYLLLAALIWVASLWGPVRAQREYRRAKTAVAEYRTTTGEWPADNEAAGLADRDTIKGKYVLRLTVNDTPPWRHITVKFDPDDAHTKIANGTLILEATDQGGSISWSCRGNESTPDITDYLPSSCKDSSTP